MSIVVFASDLNTAKAEKWLQLVSEKIIVAENASTKDDRGQKCDSVTLMGASGIHDAFAPVL